MTGQFRKLPVSEQKRLDYAIDRLRRRKLSYTAIAGALGEYEGVELTDRQVRGRLDVLGAPRNPNKTRRAVA